MSGKLIGRAYVKVHAAVKVRCLAEAQHNSRNDGSIVLMLGVGWGGGALLVA